MGHAIPVRTDYTAGEVRRFAQRAKDAAQARRLLAIAAVLEGALREEAAKIGGMDRHSPEDHVHRATRLGSSRSLNLRIGITPGRALRRTCGLGFAASLPDAFASVPGAVASGVGIW